MAALSCNDVHTRWQFARMLWELMFAIPLLIFGWHVAKSLGASELLDVWRTFVSVVPVRRRCGS